MITINGSFFCRNLTGIERFALEICKNLDKLVISKDFEIYVPANAKNVPEFKSIKLIYGPELKSFPLWEHIIFSKYLHKTKNISLNFSNVLPLFDKGMVFIHDIYAKIYPQDFNSKKDKLRRLYMCLMYKHAVKKAKHIFTVSNFSKKQISNTYKIDSNRISVIPNGWDHFLNIDEDNSIFNKFSQLKQKEFYFTLGSLQKRKNLKWIANYAQNHKDEVFAISGKAISGMVSDELSILQKLGNVILLGYVSDQQVKSLMKNCKAFIFPSYYEGFGIPPLEALSTGAKIIISNSASLPEIYSDCAYYINPNDSNISLNSILLNTVSKSDKILGYYTYKNAVDILLKELQILGEIS